MPIIQTRRDFLASPATGRRRRPRWRRRRRCAEPPLETTTVRLPSDLRHLRGAAVRRRGAAARRGLHRCPLRAGDRTGRHRRQMARARRDRFQPRISRALHVRRSMPAMPITVLAGVHPAASSCSRNDSIRTHRRPEGQERRRLALGSSPHVFLTADGRLCRARSRPRHRLGHGARRRRRWSSSPTARSTRSSASRPSRRSCAPARSAT